MRGIVGYAIPAAAGVGVPHGLPETRITINLDDAVLQAYKGQLIASARDPRRGKGKRGGLRVIYYWWLGGNPFWLFTLYDKDQADDLTPEQRKAAKRLLDVERQHRQPKEG